MPTDLLFPEEIDVRLGWPPGTAQRLARRQKLPHYVLPDGALRLRWDEVVPLVVSVRWRDVP
ncbi:MAG TPA: hypothetical protein VKE74_27170 [Gemmataceae bacterium]|nr:hypothetical protein [Gemmataceae bacterium]